MKTLIIPKNQLPLLAMILTQFAYAGSYLVSKAAMSAGMKPPIYVAYRQAIAAIALAPFAYFCERKSSSLTWCLLGKIFIASTLGLHLSLNLGFAAYNFVSATYSNAIFNLVPPLVFVIAIIFRMEKLSISQLRGQAKILGVVLGLAGAAIFSLYKGPTLYYGHKHQNAIARNYTKEETIKGCIMAVMAQVAFAIWIIMQGPILKEYKANLRMTALQFFFGSVTTGIYGAAVERNASSWKLGWNIQLVAILYSGIVLTGMGFTLQVWVVGQRGPVYPVIFNPLSLILTAVVSTVIFHETLHLGGVLGSFLLIAGLYSFLWGSSEQQVETSDAETQLDTKLESIVTPIMHKKENRMTEILLT